MKAIDLFRKYDSETDIEMPQDFNRESLLKDIRLLLEELRQKYNLECRLEDRVQDASFCAQINYNIRPAPWGNDLDSIIFSNFGRMVTISDEPFLKDAKVDIIEILQKHNFVYVNMDDTMIKYDGVVKGDEIDFPVWYSRFFAYL